MKLAITVFVCFVFFALASDLRAQQTGSDELFPILQNGKWGYINRKGEIVVEPQFLQIAGKHYQYNLE